MANTLRKLAQMILPTTDTIIYQAPNNTSDTLSAIVVTNLSGIDTTFSIHHADISGVALPSNALFYNADLIAKSVVEFGRGYHIEAGQRLRGNALSDGSVTVTVYGIEVT